MTVILAKWTIAEYHQMVESGILADRRVELLKKDVGVKQVAYAEAGIQEYWVVNLRTLQLTIFRDPWANDYVD
jgi:hypothetical protein